jgi:predicted metal-dependent hydrolase
VQRNLSDLWALFKPGGFLTNVLVQMPQFLFKDFHPKQRDTTALVERYREEYFSDKGTVAEEFKNRKAIAG